MGFILARRLWYICNMRTPKVKILLSNGTETEAQAPYIISASRATDIPAFYSKWLFERLNAGFVRWRNPFSGKDMYVSFDNLRFIVFWSKNPEPIISYLPILRERGIGCYFQYTLNDYSAENYEPSLPSLDKRIDTFKRLVETLGFGAVVWRFDPLFLTDMVGSDMLLERIYRIAKQLRGYTDKLVISFADIASYIKVTRNLTNLGVRFHEWTEEEMIEFARHLSNMHLGLEISTCAEKIDLSSYNISHNRCVDPDLICKISPEMQSIINGIRNDKGQRKLCGCITSKDIGVYNTCPHGCVYCYANTTRVSALQNYFRHCQSPLNDSII